MNRYGLDIVALEANLLEALKRYRFGWITRTGFAFAGSDDWFRPMDLGARDGSPHSGVLRKLVKKGLVEKKHRGSTRSFVYRYLRRADEQATTGASGGRALQGVRDTPPGERHSAGESEYLRRKPENISEV